MNDADRCWKQLVRAAARAPGAADAGAPFGFHTRVVARWLAGPPPPPSAWEWVSLRSLGVAVAVMLICLGVNFNVVREQFAPDPAVPADFALFFEE